MKSGLEDRNNSVAVELEKMGLSVSMKSGLEDRNNRTAQKSSAQKPLLSQ